MRKLICLLASLLIPASLLAQPVGEWDPLTRMTPNIMIGANAMQTMGPALTGAIAIGQSAGQSMYGDQSIAIGTNALQNTASGAGSATPNMAIGTNALRNLTTASNNLAYGYGALTAYTTSILGGNIAIGNYTLESTTNAETTICIGYRCGRALTTHDSTVAIGYNTLATMTSGGRELVAIGYESMSDMSGTTSIGNTAVGYGSMSNVDADYAVAIGYSAMWGDNLPTPAILGDGAVMIGYRAGQHLFGPYSIGIGYGALSGTQASGAANNVAIGKSSLAALTTGNNNVALGQLTGTALTTGTGNVFLGNNAGYYETGSSKLFIDNATRSNEADARTKALIYGVFDASTSNQSVTVNGNFIYTGTGTLPGYLKLDGTSTTTAVIPFAEGLSVPAGKKIYFGDTDAFVSPQSPFGALIFQLESTSAWSALQFQVDAPTGYIRFNQGSNDTTYDSSGIAHALGSGGFTITDHLFGDSATFVSVPDLTTPYSRFYRDLYIRALSNSFNSATMFQVAQYSGVTALNVNTLSPQINIGAKTNITVTDANAFLVENGSGTDRFLVDTNTPKIDLLANTNVGVAGTTGYNFSLHNTASNKGVFWVPGASGSNWQLQYAGKDGLTNHIQFAGSNTTTTSTWTLFELAATLSGTVGRGASLPINITVTDSRTINASGIGFDVIRAFPMTITRNSSFSSNQGGNHQIYGVYSTFTDQGTYSISTGGVTYTAYTFVQGLSNFSPSFSATSGTNTVNVGFLKMDDSSTTIGGNGNAQTQLAARWIDITDQYLQFSGVLGFGGGGVHYGMHYRPTITILSGGAFTEAALRADRSGIILASDGTKGTYSGGNLFMGASLDWERFFEADNEAVEDIPTGAVYDFRINSVDQMSLALRSLTLGDNTANDFNIAFDQTNDGSVKWDSADKTFYVRSNGSPEYTYPGYQAGVSITTYGVTSPTARYALQSWGIPSAAFGTIGGYWGGFSENDSATGYSGTEAYGGTFYNYFTGTNARTISSIFGNYVGNEVSVVSNLTATTVRGLYVGVLEGSGSMATATDVISVDISKPAVTFTGTTPTNSYYIKTGTANTFATNNYGIFLGGATNTTYRAGTQAIWSSAASTLDLTTNTTMQFKTGANPANGTAGTVGMTFNANGLGLGTAVSASNTYPFIISALLGTQRYAASLSYSQSLGNIGGWGGAIVSATNTNTVGSAAGIGLTVSLIHSLASGNQTGAQITVQGTSQTGSTARVLNGTATMNTASASTGQAQAGFFNISSPQGGAACGYLFGLGRGATGAAANCNSLDLTAIQADYLSNDTTGAVYGLKMNKGATVPTTAYTVYGWGDYYVTDDNTWSIGTSSVAIKQIFASTDINQEAGTSAVFVEVGGRLSQSTTNVGNVGTGEDDLITYSVAANTLATDGESLYWQASGTFAASINTKRIRCYFGSDTLLDTGALAITAAGSWSVEGTIIRTGAATQDQVTKLQTSDATLASYASTTAITRTLSSSNTLKCTGEATTTDDIVNSFQIVDWMPSN